MDGWIGSGVQAPEIPRTERVGSMDGIGPQVLTFAGQGTRPVVHPLALPPKQVCVWGRYRERAELRNRQIRFW